MLDLNLLPIVILQMVSLQCIVVLNCKTEDDAKKISFSVANSPLVKTAIAGEDSNFGRIIMAIGKSGEPIQVSKIQIKFGNYLITDHGKVVKDYNEKDLKEYMKWDSINIEVNLNIGNGSYTAYTCDFTHDYISINAEYN